MALASIPVPPDPARDDRAAKLVDSVGSWPLFTLNQPWGSFEAGTAFRRAPSSRDPRVRYLVNSVACQCPDYADHHNVCKHVRALVLWEQRQEAATVAPASVPKPRPSYADLYPACKGGCGDVSDTRDGYCDRCASDREWQARRDQRGSPSSARRSVSEDGRGGAPGHLLG
jgi:hypothetical protein